MEALEDGLDTPARLTDGARAHSDSQCQAVRGAVAAAMAKLLDSVGRGFFQDLHAALSITPPAIAPPGERPKKAAPRPKPSPPQSPTNAGKPSSPKTARAAVAPSELKKVNRKGAQKKGGGGVKTSTLIAAAFGLGVVVGTGLLIARWLGGGSGGGGGGRSGIVSELTPGAARQYSVQPSASVGGGGGGGAAAMPDNPLLGLLSPRGPEMGDLRRR